MFWVLRKIISVFVFNLLFIVLLVFGIHSIVCKQIEPIMVEIKNEKKENETRQHNDKARVIDDVNKEQYEESKKLSFKEQRAYLEIKAEDNDRSLATFFIGILSLVYFTLFLTTFVVLHQNMLRNVFKGIYEKKETLAALRDFGIGTGIYIVLYAGMRFGLRNKRTA